MKKSIFFLIILSGLLLAFNIYKKQLINDVSIETILKNANIPQYQYQIMHQYPHNAAHFTEGLVLQKNKLYESTGLYKQSVLQSMDIETGKILNHYSLPDNYFGEGIAILGDQLFQLTYQEHTGFVYDKNSFHLQKTFQFETEGWGLTATDKELIMSNGSATLLFLNPQTFKITRAMDILVGDKKIIGLNELEYVDGNIFANVWPTTIILIIAAKNGHVEGWINIRALKPEGQCAISEMDCVANGVAYDKQNQLLFVTGKNWPYLYALKILRN